MSSIDPKPSRLWLVPALYEQPAFRSRLLSRTCYLLANASRSCNLYVLSKRRRSENLHTHHRRPEPNGRPRVHPGPATVVGMISEGIAEAEILDAYPDLELEDIREALRYAAEAVRERELPVVGGS